MRGLGALVLACVAIAAPARADSTEDARRHFEAGVKAYDAGAYDAALAEFRAAYGDRPSPGILRNIALCLAKLGRNAEAVVVLETMLESKGSDLGSARAPAERMLAELRAKCATVHVQIVLNVPPGAVAPAPEVTLDDAPIKNPLEPVWVDPGAHTVRATAPGFTDGQTTVTVRAGDRDVPAAVSLVARAALHGLVRVTTNMPGAKVKVDGVELGRGSWQGALAPGKHRVEAEAPGFIGVIQDVEVSERSEEDVTLELKPEAPKSTAQLAMGPRLWYLGASVGFFGGELPIRDNARALVAFAFTARFGRLLGHYFAIELDGELVRGSIEYAERSDPVSFVYTHAALGPGIRFLTSEHSPRLTVLGGGGIINQNVTRKATTGDLTGGSPTGYLQIEGGAQVDFGRTIGMELVGFAGMMGVNDQHLSGSVMSRYGMRVALLFSF